MLVTEFWAGIISFGTCSQFEEDMLWLEHDDVHQPGVTEECRAEEYVVNDGQLLCLPLDSLTIYITYVSLTPAVQLTAAQANTPVITVSTSKHNWQ